VQTWIMRLACVGLFVVVAPQHSVQAEGIFSDGGPDAGTPEYYEYHANSPVGSRQRLHHGKLWPPRPRPVGPHQPFCMKYHAATYWPWPYVCQDRAVVEATSLAQIENGWCTATTLYDFHFDGETGELNTSGRRQLQWILTHVPQDFQQVHVAATFEPRTTEARTMAVQNELSLLASDRNVPVSLRAAAPLTRSAGVVEAIDRAAIQSAPAPTITYQGIASGGGGGGN
jgi:hypothetical protein